MSGQIYPIGGMTRADIIEAGAKAAHEWYRANRPDWQAKPWADTRGVTRSSGLTQAEIHYDAMEPWITVNAVKANDAEWCSYIERAFDRPDGQEFTAAVLDAIRADERAKVAEEIAAVIHDRFEHMASVEPWAAIKAAADWCEREAREAGKR